MPKSTIQKSSIIVFALFVSIVPLLFAWHLELIYPVAEASAQGVSSGFVSLDGSGAHKLYHLLLYSNFAAAWWSAFYILHSNLKLQ